MIFYRKFSTQTTYERGDVLKFSHDDGFYWSATPYSFREQILIEDVWGRKLRQEEVSN